MRYLIADVAAGNITESQSQDPLPEVGTVQAALANTLISTLDPAPVPEAEANQVLEPGPRCMFSRSPQADPIFWAAKDGPAGVMKLNGVIIALNAPAAAEGTKGEWAADSLGMFVRDLGDESDWRSNAELLFSLEEGHTVGYRGFWSCAG